MKLTEGQEEALRAVARMQSEHPDGGTILVISGYAGTGKSTTLGVLAEQHSSLFVLTPTGKAALRVKEVADCEASTIHKWMYEPYEDPETGDVRFGKKAVTKIYSPKCGFLVVDEASMLGYDLFKDIYTYIKHLGLNLVLVGDGFQLPPVEINKNRPQFSVFDSSFPATYKVNLTEVVRQALDSPIIRVSMTIRTDRHYLDALTTLPTIKNETIAPESLNILKSGGVVICHKNQTRHDLNRLIRKELKLPEHPIEAEPLLVLQNNYELDCYNGEIVDIISHPQNKGDIIVRDSFNNTSMSMTLYGVDIKTSLGATRAIIADKEVSGTNHDVRGMFISKSAKRYLMDNYDDYVEYDSKVRYVGPSILHANWGYTLTAHKAQGSEFPVVLGIMESSAKLHTPDGRRWIYTLITRAKKEIVLCWV